MEIVPILLATIGAVIVTAAIIVWETRHERRRVAMLKGNQK